MDDRVRQLRSRVRAYRRGHAATAVRYPASLREEIVTVVRAARAQGVAGARLARAIGVSPWTLSLWMRRTRRPAFRRVTLTAAPAPVAAPPPLVLVTPQGVRVEGLDLAGVITMLRALA